MWQLVNTSMNQYTSKFSANISDPLSTVDSDHRRLNNFQHIEEMAHVEGNSRVEYGGEHPWTHVWRGRIVDPHDIDALELGKNASTRERIEHEIGRLMTFLVSGAVVPSGTAPSDFEWEVFVEENNDGANSSRTVQVVWKPNR